MDACTGPEIVRNIATLSSVLGATRQAPLVPRTKNENSAVTEIRVVFSRYALSRESASLFLSDSFVISFFVLDCCLVDFEENNVALREARL